MVLWDASSPRRSTSRFVEPSSTIPTNCLTNCGRSHRCTGARCWGRGSVTSYDEVNRALRGDWLLHDRVEINVRGIPGPVRAGYAGLVTHISNWLGFTDGLKHSRMREVSRQLVNPGLAAKLQPRITHLVRDMVGEMRALETVDVLEDLALRLPVTVVCDALGMEGADAAQFHALTEDLGRFAGRVETSWGPEDQSLLDRSNQSWLALEELFRRLIAEKRLPPGRRRALRPR